jgi:ZIP family zinc transporter
MNINALTLTTIAGLSTLLGTIPIFKKIKKDKIIINSLSFAAGVMITVSLIDLIPESISNIEKTFKIFPTILITGIFTIMGIIISITIDKYINIKREGELYKVGLISMIAIILHNIPEGIITYLSSETNIKLGISLTIAIALHNIPEGISIAIPIYYGKKSRGKALYYTLISALSEPLGALLAYLFLKKIMNNIIMGIILSIVAGIMIQISTYELIPTSLKYKNKKETIIFILIGIIFMLINHLIFN